ncbi:hypothetical protein M438DRAFT_362318 [Aureobasidium pullulans EXF-150]|uniref:NADH dehydrogenase [ubiquinone] 1 alpha subcomplex subunit 1 n=2 Tax=Aureobasidium pullulans TaxID=5580 RepID=A0A074XUW1_AURPU|nr:uncharacterized protein M438DRAFT_362318 [Aureobasidium pullulans EXF-150]KEQ87414.1 hypothetical protein M438DRAFT_362318 [Aureobasidium pullulans EXF-150]THW89972.1 hypothetical protein D6D15_04882 [Aureobasidium pullulans]
MGVPFEALLPYGICLAFFGITGAGLSKIRNIQNGGKRARHSIDQWDRQSAQFSISRDHQCPGNTDRGPTTVMDRDRRLTGWLRGQVDRPIAPAGFEYSNGWRVEKNLH